MQNTLLMEFRKLYFWTILVIAAIIRSHYHNLRNYMMRQCLPALFSAEPIFEKYLAKSCTQTIYFNSKWIQLACAMSISLEIFISFHSCMNKEWGFLTYPKYVCVDSRYELGNHRIHFVYWTQNLTITEVFVFFILYGCIINTSCCFCPHGAAFCVGHDDASFNFESIQFRLTTLSMQSLDQIVSIWVLSRSPTFTSAYNWADINDITSTTTWLDCWLLWPPVYLR